MAPRSLPPGQESKPIPPRLRPWPAAGALGLALMAATAAACGGAQAAPGAGAGRQAAPTVEVAPVTQRDVSITGEWIATMDGYINAQVQPHVSGYLIRQDYREGAMVHAGQVLFEIDPRPFQAIVDQDQAQLAEARAQVGQAQAQLGKAAQDVKRDTPLAAARAVAQSQLDDDQQARAGATAAVAAARAAVAAAQAGLEQAQLNLGYTRVTSLVTGIAGAAQGQIGDLVSVSTVLTSVSQLDPIKVYFPLPEQEYLRVRASGGTPLAGVPLTLILADGSVYPHPGKVIWADRQMDPSTGTIRVAAAFPNPGNRLRPGENGQVRAVTEVYRGAVLAPQTAITELQGGFQVAVVGGGGKVKVVPVQLGEAVGNERIVTQGLTPGEAVVVAGLQYARDGATVHSVPAPPATANSPVAATGGQ